MERATEPPIRYGLGQGNLAGTQIQVLHPARRTVSRRPCPCVFGWSDESAGFSVSPTFHETGRGNRRRRTQPPRRIWVTMEDERPADDGGANGADELRVYQAHARRRPYWIGSRDCRRGT